MINDKKPDKIVQYAAEAKSKGISYGKLVAMQYNPASIVREQSKIPEGFAKCEYCGKPFKVRIKNLQRFCEPYCQKEACKERVRMNKKLAEMECAENGEKE